MLTNAKKCQKMPENALWTTRNVEERVSFEEQIELPWEQVWREPVSGFAANADGDGRPTSSNTLLARVTERLFHDPPQNDALRWRGDHALDGPAPAESASSPRPAAVLVPLVSRTNTLSMLLTRRAASLRQHASQIAFPGGKIDPGDASPLEAALREAHEEIGLERAQVRPLGYLDSYLSASGYSIVPVVGLVDPGFVPLPAPAEVDEVFEVPLDFLMNVNHHQRHSREWEGRLRHFYAMPYGDRYIWGATAGIIRNLYERLYSERPEHHDKSRV